MNNSRRITLIVAIVLALGTGVLTLRYLTSLQAASTPPPSESREVLVAVQDIPARGTISLDMVRTTTRSSADVDPDAVSDPKVVNGAIALITIPSGSVITSSKIGRPTEEAMPVRLHPGMRALTLSGDRVKAVSGFVQPGDRVDIIALPPRTGVTPEGVTILRGVLVLAINSTMEDQQAGGTPSADTGNPATITVELTPKQTDLLAAVDNSIPLRLALRSPQEPVNSLPDEPLILANPNPPAPPPPPAPPVDEPPPPPPGGAVPAVGGGVTVIDGDKVVSK
jgi:pilus assembly protein CpaB